MRSRVWIGSIAALWLGFPAAAPGQSPAGESAGDGAASLQDLNRQLNNPVSSIWSLNFQNNFAFSEGDLTDRTRWLYNMNFQPVLPIPLTESWNLITRPVFPVLAGVDVLGPGGWKERSGFGDMTVFSLLAPASSSGFLWGVGPSLIFPTASNDDIGQEKWQAGPAAVGLYLGKQWIFGALGQQWWSYAGKDSRPETSQANLQYFLFYLLPDHWQVGMAPNILVDWKADSGNKLTLPIGFGVGKLFKFDRLPVKVTLEVDYSVVRPDDFGQRWLVRLQVIPVLPALVKDPLFR